jgi:hypothetical protein
VGHIGPNDLSSQSTRHARMEEEGPGAGCQMTSAEIIAQGRVHPRLLLSRSAAGLGCSSGWGRGRSHRGHHAGDSRRGAEEVGVLCPPSVHG